MARNSTLHLVLDMYRAEARISMHSALNTQAVEAQRELIRRTQTWLWEDFDWPLLRVERTIDIQEGQRYYEIPSDLTIDRIEKVELFYDQAYGPLKAGIDAEHYTAYNSDLDQRQSPPQRWRISEDEQLEVWPIPDMDADTTSLEGRIKITGIRKLQPLVEDTHRLDLDDRMVSLYCAADTLAASGAKDANLKLDQANKRYAKLRGSQMPRKKFRMFGVGQDIPVRRIPIVVYNRTS